MKKKFFLSFSLSFLVTFSLTAFTNQQVAEALNVLQEMQPRLTTEQKFAQQAYRIWCEIIAPAWNKIYEKKRKQNYAVDTISQLIKYKTKLQFELNPARKESEKSLKTIAAGLKILLRIRSSFNVVQKSSLNVLITKTERYLAWIKSEIENVTDIIENKGSVGAHSTTHSRAANLSHYQPLLPSSKEALHRPVDSFRPSVTSQSPVPRRRSFGRDSVSCYVRGSVLTCYPEFHIEDIHGPHQAINFETLYKYLLEKIREKPAPNGKGDQSLHEDKFLKELHFYLRKNGGIKVLFQNLLQETQDNLRVRRLFFAKDGIFDNIYYKVIQQSRVGEPYVVQILKSFEAIDTWSLRNRYRLPNNVTVF
jgi:hypothetical protein